MTTTETDTVVTPAHDLIYIGIDRLVVLVSNVIFLSACVLYLYLSVESRELVESVSEVVSLNVIFLSALVPDWYLKRPIGLLST